MMKKIMCVCLLGVSLMSMTACSGNEGAKNEEAQKETIQEESIEDEALTEEEMLATDEETDLDGSIQKDDMIGKTLFEALEEGYEYQGHSAINASYTFQLSSEIADDATMEKITQLEGLTLKELIDKDLSIGYFSMGDDYQLMTDIGSVNVSFEVEDAADIIQKYKEEDSFADIADMEELYDKTISNVTFNYMQYQVVFDETFDAMASEEGFELGDSPEEQLKDCVIKEFTYEPISEDFLN